MDRGTAKKEIGHVATLESNPALYLLLLSEPCEHSSHRLFQACSLIFGLKAMGYQGKKSILFFVFFICCREREMRADITLYNSDTHHTLSNPYLIRIYCLLLL